MNLFLKIVTSLAFFAASLWLYFEPKFESISAFFVSLAALVTLFVSHKLTKKQPNQNQSISDSSEGIQAGRDVNIKK